ncbi:MAG: hypothetical protein JXA30_22150 [Deltaproteobacteria bacterium]|nr:hypothetical protein [Deltaproteobacteria bacterium]
MGAGLSARIDGSYSNLFGLPAAHTIALMEHAGILFRWP